MTVNKNRPPYTLNEQEIKVTMGSLRALHTLLWHIRDEMGNRRAKDRLTEAIEMVEQTIGGDFNTKMENLVEGKAR